MKKLLEKEVDKTKHRKKIRHTIQVKAFEEELDFKPSEIKPVIWPNEGVIQFSGSSCDSDNEV